MTAEEYIVSVLQPLPYPVTLGKGSPLTSIPYIQVWHIQDTILNDLATGQTCYQSSLARIEYLANTDEQGLQVRAAIRPLLRAPILILNEGETITNPVTGQSGNVSPPPGGSCRWFMVCCNIAMIPANS